ncbi:alpha/beta fold hydrolase [Duganella sp. BJB488]|nr:alpha/beta fold hydrolase [Duganella sp. BJB489]RFP25258.1 alpha/beta fold hydrolase [Duganella sp. BJB488]RFP34237.1 alpha/beta fold hydrolase [Duganella sp. BJB480]
MAALAGANAAEAPVLPQVLAVRPAAAQPIATGSTENFTGIVHIGTPFQAPPPGRAGGAAVTFAAGARTAWHTHPLGQTLIVTAGLGLVQQQGQAAHLIRPGDVVTIPANVRHWHGAGPTDSMTHIAIAEKSDGNSVAWQGKVADQEYQAALTSTGLTPAAAARQIGDADRTAPSDRLSARQQAIPLIASFAAASDMPRLRAALNQGLDTGLTISEAKEILVQLYAYAGFPKSLNALGELMQVVEARKQRGIHDAPGREPGKAIATGNALAAIGKANQSEISGGPVTGPVFDFAPIINQYLQTHLFGDIFERDNLDWRSRELATLGALAATPGAEAQLRSHMRAGMRVGLSAAQLRQMMQVLLNHGSPEAASRADDALTQALAAGPMLVQAQGSFAAGGTELRQGADGASFHGDHLYAFYQIPQHPKALPIVMLHGAYQSARSWESTPDGREGFQNLFLRRGFPVYLVDQPRRGRAGNSTVAASVEPTPNDQLFFDQFRIGKWPNYYDNVQFDRQPQTLDQFFRSVTPNTGPYDAGVVSDAMSALFTRVGPAILFTHSQGGGPGWLTAIKNPNVKAIVAFEPGSGFVFPQGEAPPAMPSAAGTLSPEVVPPSDFQQLTRLPIVIYYGDNFPEQPSKERGQDNWRVRFAMARLWVDAINKHGGDARLVHLPEIGIRGNTHFLMSDLNNVQIADQVSQFLAEKNLDALP